MPSAFTHMLVGAAVAQLAPSGLPRGRLTIALALASAVPDLDVFAFRYGIPYAHALGHRGLSHSLVAALVIGLIAIALAVANRRLLARHFKAITLMGFAGVASHGLLDAATDAGLGIGFFIPFSDERYFLPFRPIETASLNPFDFFSYSGWLILKNEMMWIWLPLAACMLLGMVAAQTRRRSRTPMRY